MLKEPKTRFLQKVRVHGGLPNYMVILCTPTQYTTVHKDQSFIKIKLLKISTTGKPKISYTGWKAVIPYIKRSYSNSFRTHEMGYGCNEA